MSKNKPTKNSRSLVIKRLENVSKIVFKKHYDLITDLVGSTHGIYALYDGNDLYYVGKSIDLRKRVKQHLRDKHLANWTHFSLYLVRNAEHIHEIESLLIRISNPKGNRIIPKGNSSGAMLKQLKAMVKEKQKEELEQMFGPSSRGTRKKISSDQSAKTLIGLVSKPKKLFKEYKGKEYTATLTRTGKIIFKNKFYSTPTAAALSVVDRKTVNGWKFWFIKDTNGDWVRLCDYRE
jgi:hypothetical protein